MKVMPLSGSAGANVSVAGSPENSPGPLSETSFEMVRCCKITRVRAVDRPNPAKLYLWRAKHKPGGSAGSFHNLR
jgi:hypothetical protein